MAEKSKRIELRVSEDFYKRVDMWRRKWGWTMTVAVSYMLSEQMNFLENHRYKNAGVQPPNPYPDTKNDNNETFNQEPKVETSSSKLLQQIAAQRKHGSKL